MPLNGALLGSLLRPLLLLDRPLLRGLLRTLLLGLLRPLLLLDRPLLRSLLRALLLGLLRPLLLRRRVLLWRLLRGVHGRLARQWLRRRLARERVTDIGRKNIGRGAGLRRRRSRPSLQARRDRRRRGNVQRGR